METFTKGILVTDGDNRIVVTLNGEPFTVVDAFEVNQTMDGTEVNLIDFNGEFPSTDDDFDNCNCHCDCESCCGDEDEDCDEDEDFLTIDEINMYILNNLIENVYFNEVKKTTTVKPKLGDAVTVRCGKDDKYDKEVGLKTALLKVLVGSGKFNNVVNHWLDVEDKRVKDAKEKAEKKNKKVSTKKN